jgi:hypothetical protein
MSVKVIKLPYMIHIGTDADAYDTKTFNLPYLKRFLLGTFHGTSHRYTQDYLNEFNHCFRNHRRYLADACSIGQQDKEATVMKCGICYGGNGNGVWLQVGRAAADFAKLPLTI